jgi:hypothetical protein
MAEIVAIPAILAFPPEVHAQLDQLCELCGFTHHRLVVEAVKSQQDRWKQISDEVLTPLAPGEIEVWPEDPLDLLARVVALHAMRLSHQRYEDPLDSGKTRNSLRQNGLSARRKIWTKTSRPSLRILGAENITSASEHATSRGFATDHLVEVDIDIVFLHVARRLR